MEPPRLAHVDERGAARIVDITGKEPTARHAVARGSILLPPAVVESLRGDDASVLEVARLSAISAAKHTSRLIPLCHPIRIDQVEVHLDAVDTGVEATASVHAFERTGPEMEALVACSAALLCVASAFKHAAPKPMLDQVVLVKKSGGKSGTWERPGSAPDQAVTAPHTEAS